MGRIKSSCMGDVFSIEILEKRWLSGMPEAHDLCAHGIIRVRVGERVIEDEVSLSAAGLQLLRSAARGHERDEMAKLFPVDGFCWTPGPEGELYLGGCPNGGIDGDVTLADDVVRIALDDAPAVRIPLDAYREQVRRYADEVETFFEASQPKRPEETGEMNRLWYPLFWTEWRKWRCEL